MSAMSLLSFLGLMFLSLTDKEVLGEGDDTKLEIQLDKENKILSLHYRGVGMTKEDLIKNLGTIAKFFGEDAYNGDLNLIGQFGFGFYSVSLVADYSKAAGAFAISEDTYSEPLGRGTRIRLHIRIEPRSDKESIEAEINADMVPVDSNEEDDELVGDKLELKRREKGKRIEETRTFMPRKNFNKLSEMLYQALKELLPSMVNNEVKKIAKMTVQVYVAEGLLLEIQKHTDDVAAMIAEAI
ncbi:endoplasmin [Tanacetum coccineum]